MSRARCSFGVRPRAWEHDFEVWGDAVLPRVLYHYSPDKHRRLPRALGGQSDLWNARSLCGQWSLRCPWGLGR
eukprot:9472210-Pyramimonas_sp.AAC.1